MIRNIYTTGFTLIEVVVVIAILGILATLTSFGYGNWQQGLTQRQAQSDLQIVATAMESAKNFSNGYPTDIPTTFKASDGVTVSYVGGNASAYCIEARGTRQTSVVYYVDSSLGKDPRSGTCATSYTLTAPVPTVSAITTTSMTVSWPSVPNATGYVVKYGPATPSATASCTTSPCSLTGLTSSTNYKITVTANSPFNSKTSAIVSGTTLTPPTLVAAGTNFTCAVLTGVPYCSGANADGQLGNGSTTSSTTKVGITMTGALSGLSIEQIAAGTYHICAIASNKKVYCWGDGTNGGLGNGSTADALTPTAVSTSGVLSGKNINQVDANTSNTCVIASDNMPYCWGYNYWGQLGNGTTVDSSVPVAVTMSGVLAGKTAKSITNGYGYACIIASDDKPYCWGYGVGGSLGNGSVANSSVPVAVDTSGALAGKTVTKIAAGNVTCAVASGDAYCWGDNVSGQLGNNTTGGNSTTPVAVYKAGALSGKTIKDMAIGTQSPCVISSDDKPYCWGVGYNGRLGNGAENNSSVPVAVTTSGVLSGKVSQSIAVGAGTPCVVTTVSEVYCWGYNTFGEFAIGNTTSSFVPVRAYN